MEPREGVEPTAYCVQSSCTTIVLSRQFGIDRGFITHEERLFVSLVAVDARWDTCPSRIGGEGGTRTPMPVRTSVFKTDAMTVLPPLHSAGLSPLVTFAKVGTCRSQRSARLNGLPVWTRTRNSRINSAVHYHCATGK